MTTYLIRKSYELPGVKMYRTFSFLIPKRAYLIFRADALTSACSRTKVPATRALWPLMRSVMRRGTIRSLSTRLKEMKVKELLKMLEEDGWNLSRTRGSHRQFKHPMKPGLVTVAGKPSADVPKGTLNAILKQSGLKE